ncbi:MAG TPA: HupE/UreJ family protein [Methylocella sp.]|nr:HupE/UreJ family protein [Methylocella sp.]
MRLFVLFLLFILWPHAASAHKSSDSYLSLSLQGARIEGQLDTALRDLDYVLGIDADGNGEIAWGEVKAKHRDITAYALPRLEIAADGAKCSLTPAGHLIDNHSDGAYAVFRFAADCPHPPEALEITYRLFFDADPQHRGLLRLESSGGTRTAIFAPGSAKQSFPLSRISAVQQFRDYFLTGVEHIWSGYDHILFLLSLLLPAVMAPGIKRWEPAAGFRPAFLNVLAVVTAFTAAHSITLSLATLKLIILPARLSESAIALSVTVAALNNLHPLIRRRQWIVAFCFGLVHGFGFANVLAGLGLPQGALTLALVGFNLGVEAGQIAIVAAFLPLAYAMRGTWFYRYAVLDGGSVLIAGVAALWFFERSLNIEFLPVH